MEFLLALLEVESSPLVRQRIVDRLGRHPHARVREALERVATSDPDVAFRWWRWNGCVCNEQKKCVSFFGSGWNSPGQVALGQFQANWRAKTSAGHRSYGAQRSQASCRCLLRLFSLKPLDQPIRVLAFGDFGNGSIEQKEVASAMQRFHQTQPFDFAITLGDNFYSVGMESPTDPRWKTWWNELYDPLGIKFYVSLGNHDWGSADSPAAEVLYTTQQSELEATRHLLHVYRRPCSVLRSRYQRNP